MPKRPAAVSLPESVIPPTVAAPDARSVLDALAAGTLSDDLFDRLLAPRWRVRSAVHWTPVAVAYLAIRWLTEGGARRVLDVGAGVGKLCVLGALCARDVRFVGIERRLALVSEARHLAKLLGVSDRVEIREGTLETIDPHEFDAFYLYNPFVENLPECDDDRIDKRVDLDPAHFARDVEIVDGWLRAARNGTRVVTLHGFGGLVPLTYRRVGGQRVGWDSLTAWEQVTGRRGDHPPSAGRPG